ncbi:metal-dependent hydrolase [Halomarina litorea]|uniref:metal-dependent hydrolase n=1 Tax=Halomarina litorea TaxID=2961595 RepID=UPI0020C4BE2E|nr:metal-dependent hydrolase [Halomarina sp. BCD28]
MWPWGHAAFGYLLYRALLSARGSTPTGLPVLALGVGTQFPDLVDKPLAWSFALLPSGRSLAHSLLTAALVIGVGGAVARRYDRRDVAAAFGVGYLSHLLGDALLPLVRLDVVFLRFLAWPLVPPPPYERDSSFAEHLVSLEVTPFFAFGLALTALAVALWVRDGLPGLGTLAAPLRGWRD